MPQTSDKSSVLEIPLTAVKWQPNTWTRLDFTRWVNEMICPYLGNCTDSSLQFFLSTSFLYINRLWSQSECCTLGTGLASPCKAAGIVIIFWMEHQLSLWQERLWRIKLCKIGTVELKLIELPSGFLEITFPKTNLLRFVVILPYASLGLSKIDDGPTVEWLSIVGLPSRAIQTSTDTRNLPPRVLSTESSPKHAYQRADSFQSTWFLSLAPHFLFSRDERSAIFSVSSIQIPN